MSTVYGIRPHREWTQRDHDIARQAMSRNIDTTDESPTPSKKHYRMTCEPGAIGASMGQAEKFMVNGFPATREQFVAACRRLKTPDAVIALARLGETP